MTRNLLTGLAAGLVLLAAANHAEAQTLRHPEPITRILAIGTLAPGASAASIRPILPVEVRDTVKLYLAGKIDQWFSLSNGRGVVFLLNVTDIESAKTMLEGLPLGRAHLIRFQLLPLAPLVPLSQLIGLQPRAQ